VTRDPVDMADPAAVLACACRCARRWAYPPLIDLDEAESIATLAAAVAIATYRPEMGEAAGWIMMRVRSAIVDERRRLIGRTGQHPRQVPTDPFPEAADTGPLPGDVIQVVAFLDSLSPAHRETTDLALEGLGRAAIARDVAMRPSSITSRFHVIAQRWREYAA
jgi:hypothetical protein